jgi:hypothetical protein
MPKALNPQAYTLHPTLNHNRACPLCDPIRYATAGPERWCSCFFEAAGATCADASNRPRPPRAAITYLLYGPERLVNNRLLAVWH